MTERNIGFVSEAQQAKLRRSRVFIIGVGGMGGACLQTLIRSGIENFTLVDIDVFEYSNLNRQVFSSIKGIGRDKVEETVLQLRQINPEAKIRVINRNWLNELDEVLPDVDLIINGMDDIKSGILLYRKAKLFRRAVIDAYTSPLPSVTLVRARDPRPEERLSFPSLGKDETELSDKVIADCRMKELLYVMTHSNWLRAVDFKIAREIIAGTRARASFAPMVITTGNLMAYTVIEFLLGRKIAIDCKGVFLNPYTAQFERESNFVKAAVKQKIIQLVMEYKT